MNATERELNAYLAADTAGDIITVTDLGKTNNVTLTLTADTIDSRKKQVE